jgi:hemerythrin-like domain-containing protein
MTVTATVPARPDVHEMVVIHRVFRRELHLIPRIVLDVPAGDTARVRIVGEHLEFVLGTLHSHHTGEDAILWPRLLQRATPSAALVHTMQEQHHRVEQHVEETTAALSSWMRVPGPMTALRLARTVDDLRAALLEHLDLEEREILPLISAHISVAEWQSLAEHGKNHTPRAQLPLVFGAILEEADATERAALLAAVPAPVRFFLRTAGARQYRRYVNRVRGGR